MTKILLLATVPPWPPVVGGNQRTNLLLKALSEYGEVDVACVYQGSISEASLQETMDNCSFLGHFKWEDSRFHWSQRLVKKVASWIGYPRSLELLRTELLRDRFRYEPDPQLQAWLRNLFAKQSYDLIVSRFLLPLSKTDAAKQGTVILDVDDLGSVHYETRMEQSDVPWHSRLLLAECARYCRSVQKKLFATCRYLWFVSKQDLESNSNGVPSSVLPNIPYWPAVADDFRPCEESLSSQTLLTIGALNYAPNRHGIDWFLSKVWPHVLLAQPNAEYMLVGQVDDVDARRWQNAPGVRVTGRVDDLRPYYSRSALTVSPVLIGAGTKIKVLESLAYGRCCVATPHSSFGYEEKFPDGSGLIYSNTESDMIEKCIKYLREPSARVEMSKAGNQVILNNFTYASFSAVVHSSLESVLSDLAPQSVM